MLFLVCPARPGDAALRPVLAPEPLSLSESQAPLIRALTRLRQVQAEHALDRRLLYEAQKELRDLRAEHALLQRRLALTLPPHLSLSASLTLRSGAILTPPTRSASRGATSVTFTLTEWRHLELLIEASAPVSQAQFLEVIYGGATVAHTPQVHLARIRKKLAQIGAQDDLSMLRSPGGSYRTGYELHIQAPPPPDPPTDEADDD